MKRKLWPWFLVGFAATFFLLATLVKSYVMLPSGAGVTRVALWRYYAAEWPRIFESQALGPATASQEGLFATTLQHLGLAVVGGLLLLTVARWIQRRTRNAA